MRIKDTDIRGIKPHNSNYFACADDRIKIGSKVYADWDKTFRQHTVLDFVQRGEILLALLDTPCEKDAVTGLDNLYVSKIACVKIFTLNHFSAVMRIKKKLQRARNKFNAGIRACNDLGINF